MNESDIDDIRSAAMTERDLACGHVLTTWHQPGETDWCEACQSWQEVIA